MLYLYFVEQVQPLMYQCRVCHLHQKLVTANKTSMTQINGNFDSVSKYNIQSKGNNSSLMWKNPLVSCVLYDVCQSDGLNIKYSTVTPFGNEEMCIKEFRSVW